MKALSLLIFYTIFVLYVVNMSLLSGTDILSNTEGFENLANPTGYDLINPFYIIPAMWSLASISSEYLLLYVGLIAPFIMSLIYIIAAFIRGNDV